MNWLKRNFGRLDEEFTKVQREQHARTYILIIIEGLLMSDKSQNLVHLRWLLKLVDFREANELSWGYEFLPTREAIVTPELACYLEYMSWFRVYGKSYLLTEKVRGRQSHTRRPRQMPRNPRRGSHDGAVKTGPLSTPIQQPTPITAPAPGQ
ncbi:hypothetical protein Godav_012211 [Gossypium davidsonii]|uniref:Aminotransferase-like plant mobile domain-containing protein n=1 Tax=Gossypium davidsonii TaxID=34287 RepID=A0A7J8RDS7_GOSDV|nr:hypothetical protein [Gossypium davidsonii]